MLRRSYIKRAVAGNFGLHSQDGETFAFGALVGRIGTGDWFLLGASFDEVVIGGAQEVVAQVIVRSSR